jgi:hypothetical protein
VRERVPVGALRKFVGQADTVGCWWEMQEGQTGVFRGQRRVLGASGVEPAGMREASGARANGERMNN